MGAADVDADIPGADDAADDGHRSQSGWLTRDGTDRGGGHSGQIARHQAEASHRNYHHQSTAISRAAISETTTTNPPTPSQRHQLLSQTRLTLSSRGFRLSTSIPRTAISHLCVIICVIITGSSGPIRAVRTLSTAPLGLLERCSPNQLETRSRFGRDRCVAMKGGRLRHAGGAAACFPDIMNKCLRLVVFLGWVSQICSLAGLW